MLVQPWEAHLQDPQGMYRKVTNSSILPQVIDYSSEVPASTTSIDKVPELQFLESLSMPAYYPTPRLEKLVETCFKILREWKKG